MPRTKKTETEALVPAEPKKRRTPAAAPKTTTTAVNHKHTTKKATATAEMLAPKAVKPVVAHEEIEQLAYSYWVARGCQGGSSQEDWFRAEQQLKG